MRDLRRKNQELPTNEVISILKTGTSGVLALLGDEDYPYAVPLSYAYDERKGKIFFHSSTIGHKIDAIKRHSKASFCVIAEDDVKPAEYTTYFKSIIAFGKVRILDTDEEKRPALELLAARYSPDLEAGRLAEIDRLYKVTTMLELKIEHIKGKEAKKLMMKRKKG